MTTTDMENILDFDKEVTGENNLEIIRENSRILN
jgi:hypothetical protein